MSYVMGELLDSSDEVGISTARFAERVRSYLPALGGKVDLWEIGNEVNGNWTGPYPVVSAKLTAAYKEVNAAGGRTALTLYTTSDAGRAGRTEPLAFSRRSVPSAVRSGLDYVFLSLNAPATSRTIRRATSLMRYYYGLPIRLPCFADGYF
jgi:hypothetical protein